MSGSAGTSASAQGDRYEQPTKRLGGIPADLRAI